VTADATYPPSYRETFHELHVALTELESSWRERWVTWQAGAYYPHPLGFVTHVILDGGEITARRRYEALVGEGLSYIAEEHELDASVQLAFLSGYGEAPAPATLIGFDWFSDTADDLKQLERIVPRIYTCLRALVPTLAKSRSASSRVPRRGSWPCPARFAEFATLLPGDTEWVLDLSHFSDPVEIAAEAVRVGDYVEHVEPTHSGGVYTGKRTRSGIVVNRSATVGLDGKLNFDLRAPLGVTQLRLKPDSLVSVRRPD